MAEQSANRLQYAGEYTLEGLELRTVRGNFNITRNYVQLDLFENIFKQGPIKAKRIGNIAPIKPDWLHNKWEFLFKTVIRKFKYEKCSFTYQWSRIR